MNKIIKQYSSVLAVLLLSASSISVVAMNNSYGVSDATYSSISNRVESMNYDQLSATRSSLLAEQANLNNLKDSTQSCTK